MNGFKRILVSITAKAGRIVDDFENHEAVAEAALREFGGLLAKVEAQARSSQMELSNLEQRIASLETEEQRWSQRAVAEQQRDHARALECVRRVHAKRRDRAAAQKQRLALTATLRDIEQRRDELKTQLTALQQKQRQLVARQSYSDAQNLSRETAWNSSDPLDVFARWETHLSTTESLHVQTPPADLFAQEFVEAEEEQALQATLDALTSAASPEQQR